MICTSTSGTTISSSERPNIVCGSSRLIRLCWRMSSISGARSGVASARVATASAASLGLERIAGAAHRLQIARVARVALDLAAQPRHLHVDIADVAAELRRLRQLLARHRLPGARRRGWPAARPRRRSGARSRRRETARRGQDRSGTPPNRTLRSRIVGDRAALAGCCGCAAPARAARTAWRDNRRRPVRAR